MSTSPNASFGLVIGATESWLLPRKRLVSPLLYQSAGGNACRSTGRPWIPPLTCRHAGTWLLLVILCGSQHGGFTARYEDPVQSEDRTGILLKGSRLGRARRGGPRARPRNNFAGHLPSLVCGRGAGKNTPTTLFSVNRLASTGLSTFGAGGKKVDIRLLQAPRRQRKAP